ncbi:MAG: hypothetical protein ABJQ39_04570 [Winogradskyella arenosi]
MKIENFKEFIREFPYKNQSFDIKKQNWQIESQQQTIDWIFGESETITLNRFDLLNSVFDLESFILKTLMWGYPTKGRGKNIEKILESVNLERLKKILSNYKKSAISIEQLRKDIKSIPGLGLSTMTKFTHFLNTTIEGNKAVILDERIIRALKRESFEEFEHLKKINHSNAQRLYPEYLKTVDKLSKSMNVLPDQIEMFLFTFGNTLSELKGEECYDYD